MTRDEMIDRFVMLFVPYDRDSARTLLGELLKTEYTRGGADTLRQVNDTRDRSDTIRAPAMPAAPPEDDVATVAELTKLDGFR